MTEDESLAEAHRILSDAGWRGIAKAPWNGLCAAPGLVGGFAPNGDQYAKAYTAFPQAMASAMGLDPADYPDEAHEAAAWLVRHVQGPKPQPAVYALDPAPEAEQSCAGGEPHVYSEEPVAESFAGETGEPDAGGGGDFSGAGEPAAEDVEAEAVEHDEPLEPAEISDADYSEIERALLTEYIPPDDPPAEVEGGNAEFPALEEDIKDFAPDEVADDVAEAVAIFGDNLPMARLVLIGKVTTLAAEYKAALQEGWTREEFAYLQNWVARVAEGKADDEPVLRERFNWVSAQSRAMSAIDAYAESQVEYINAATREQIESYDPEEGWP